MMSECKHNRRSANILLIGHVGHGTLLAHADLDKLRN